MTERLSPAELDAIRARWKAPDWWVKEQRGPYPALTNVDAAGEDVRRLLRELEAVRRVLAELLEAVTTSPGAVATADAVNRARAELGSPGDTPR